MASETIKIRNATESDLSDILQIYSYYVENSLATFEEFVPSIDEMSSRFATSQNDNLPYLVAELGNQIVGYAYAFKYRKRDAYRFSLEESVYLKEGYAGKGIGKLLLGELLDIVTKLGYKQIIAVITDHEGSGKGSIMLHKKMGFYEAGRFRNVGFKFEKWADTVLMQKSL